MVLMTAFEAELFLEYVLIDFVGCDLCGNCFSLLLFWEGNKLKILAKLWTFCT